MIDIIIRHVFIHEMLTAVEIRLSNVSESVLEARGVVTMALQVLGQSSIDVRVNITTLDGTATGN